MSYNKKESIKDFIVSYLHDDANTHNTQALVDAAILQFEDELSNESREIEAVLWYLISSGLITCGKDGALASNLRK